MTIHITNSTHMFLAVTIVGVYVCTVIQTQIRWVDVGVAMPDVVVSLIKVEI